jgi:anti-anti-sigma factor
MSKDRTPDPYGVEPARGEKPATGAGAQAPAFSARIQDGVHVVRLERASVLDAYEIERLGDDIYAYIKPIDGPWLVVDLANVEHLSSAALGMLIALRRVVVEKKGGGLALANVNRSLQSIFEMTRLHKLIAMRDSTEKAVRRTA